jgi:predicted deacylase
MLRFFRAFIKYQLFYNSSWKNRTYIKYRRNQMKKKVTSFLIIQLILIASAFIFADVINDSNQIKVFQVGKIKAPPGEKVSGFLQIEGGKFPDTKIPITIINGSKEGPILALVAGIHGYEYPPILALQRLRADLKPEELSGKVILVHIANLQSFQKRTIYYNPNDWLNLNRVFLGKPDGTISERVAYVITTEIVDKCDYLVDMHCGDGNEALIPYTYWTNYGNSKIDTISKNMAEYFGINIIIDDKTRPKDPKASIYLGNTAIVCGKPAITIESGMLGGVSEEDIVRVTQGAKNLMKYFNMIPGEPKKHEDIRWIKRYEIIRSNFDGIFYPLAKLGSSVKKGELLGYVTDYFGKKIQSAQAPFDGLILYILNTPPINKGEPLVEVGEPK